jgi:GTP pyrophosphokinase
MYLKPDVYAQISDGIERYQVEGQAYINRVTTMIQEVLAQNEIRGRVSGRIKHIYSVYQKMKQRGLGLDQIFDVIAFRVIVNNLRECYTVLGLVHSLWKPVPGKFKDYISMPKANMYQSLHSTVIGPDGERIEIQIRTEEMHQLAEYGVAAHWAYKEQGSKKSQETEDRFSWLRQILDWQGDLQDSRDFMSTLSMDLVQEEVYVFTPQGQVKELPEGSTPVDFAYSIHTEVGNHCAGAKVNGRLVPLSTPLQNGDTVEIITDASRNPSRDWLHFIKTGKARSRVKHWINTEERARSLTLAKEFLEKEGRRMGINVAKALKAGAFEPVVKEFSFRQVDDLFSAVGHGRLTARQVLRKLLPKDESKAVERKTSAQPSVRSSGPKDAISIQGVDGVLIRYAQCCNPLPGDPIVGYISRGLGVTIHTQDCPNVANMEIERLLDVTWDGEDASKVLPARIKIICKNQRGVLGQVTSLLAKEEVNIDSGHFSSDVDGTSVLEFVIEVKTTTQLYGIIEKLRKLDAIQEVTRTAAG